MIIVEDENPQSILCIMCSVGVHAWPQGSDVRVSGVRPMHEGNTEGENHGYVVFK